MPKNSALVVISARPDKSEHGGLSVMKRQTFRLTLALQDASTQHPYSSRHVLEPHFAQFPITNLGVEEDKL